MDQTQNAGNFGRLIVQTTAAVGAIPIRDATVVIRLINENGQSSIFTVLNTGIDGKTPPVEIPTPSPAESLSPGGAKPFSELSLEIAADGYFSVVDTHVPIYPGITSIQPVWMIPVPDSDGTSRFPSGNIIVNEEFSNPNL